MTDDQEIPALVISPQTLLLEGARAFFAGTRYRVHRECTSVAKAIEFAGEAIDLVFIGTSLSSDTVEPLRSLKASFPHSRIVVYAQKINLPPSILIDIFGTCLDGCLIADASSHVLRQSLDLIMMGEHVFPFSLLLSALPNDREMNENSNLPNGQYFSDRERQVLQFLRNGRSNKFIARELQLSEATVKVHIKTLLRKIGASNRTQAAIWVTKQCAVWNEPDAIWNEGTAARDEVRAAS